MNREFSAPISDPAGSEIGAPVFGWTSAGVSAISAVGMKGEELLYLFFLGAGKFMRPTFHNLIYTPEDEDFQHGLRSQLLRLERHGLIERRAATADRLHRLTRAGHLLAMGGRNPEKQWNRRWDGRWRLAIFDIPETRRRVRLSVRRFLQARGFGFLQQSVWVSPDPLDAEVRELGAQGNDVESFMTLESQPSSAETDQAIVAGAWDFAHVNSLYRTVLDVLGNTPDFRRDVGPSTALREWALREREAWNSAVSADPLLPKVLLPKGYMGMVAWEKRQNTLDLIGRTLGFQRTDF